MARNKFTSPRLEITITADDYETAKRSSSGSCLIADAIKRTYPELSKVTVDMTTIRVSDQKKGERYTYLTAPDAQQLLVFFDASWPLPKEELLIERALKIDPITASSARTQAREERRRELEAKEASGDELTHGEKISLTKIRKGQSRPTSRGPTALKAGTSRPVVRGGRPVLQGIKEENPNLLRGTNRHFGAKLAEPGLAFREAVAEAVEEEVARRLADAAAT